MNPLARLVCRLVGHRWPRPIRVGAYYYIQPGCLRCSHDDGLRLGCPTCGSGEFGDCICHIEAQVSS